MFTKKPSCQVIKTILIQFHHHVITVYLDLNSEYITSFFAPRSFIIFSIAQGIKLFVFVYFSCQCTYADEDFAGGNCGFLEYDQGQLQYEWYPDYVDQAAEFSNHVWENDKYVDDFQPDHHPQLTMLY